MINDSGTGASGTGASGTGASGTGDLGTDTPPDRLASHPKSPFYNAALLERGVGVRFKGVEKNNVDEYCVSEGWVRLAVGKAVDRTGAPMTMKLMGPVEVYFRDIVEGGA